MTEFEYWLYCQRKDFGVIRVDWGVYITDDFGKLVGLSNLQIEKIAIFRTSGRVLN